MPHSDEPLNPPRLEVRELRPGDWIGSFHVADVRGGTAIVVYDLGWDFDTAEIEKFGRKLRLRKQRESN